jgi:hypothetical protein
VPFIKDEEKISANGAIPHRKTLPTAPNLSAVTMVEEVEIIRQNTINLVPGDRSSELSKASLHQVTKCIGRGVGVTARIDDERGDGILILTLKVTAIDLAY